MTQLGHQAVYRQAVIGTPKPRKARRYEVWAPRPLAKWIESNTW